MPPPCQHAAGQRPPPGQPYHPEDCRLCWLYQNVTAYRTFWDGAGSSASRPQPCRWRGQELRVEACPRCQGRVRVKVLACTRHGECTAAKPLNDIACCAHCSDYEADSESAALLPSTPLVRGGV